MSVRHGHERSILVILPAGLIFRFPPETPSCDNGCIALPGVQFLIKCDFMPLPIQPGRSHNTSRRNAEPAPIQIGLLVRAAVIFGASTFVVSAVLRQLGFIARAERLCAALLIACVITAIIELFIARADKPNVTGV